MSATLRRYGILWLAVLGYIVAIKPMVYFVGFLSNRWVSRTIDGEPVGSLAASIAIDIALVAFFAVVHSLLARPSAKSRLTRYLAAELERSFYSAISGAQLLLLIWAWRPIPRLLWHFDAHAIPTALWTLHWLGWGLVVAGVLSLRSSRLYGLAPAWAGVRGRQPPKDELLLRGPYRWIRHPLYAGTLLALWATPEMSAGRALLAGLFSLYILVGKSFEERDLLKMHGARYARYCQQVPAFVPRRLAPASERALA